MNTFEDPSANIDNSTGEEVEVEAEVAEDDDQNIAEAEEKSEQIEKWETLLGPEKVTEIRETIKRLQEPMKKMIEPVLENIKNGDYQLLIGDDASGRIPTLIMRAFINEAYEQAHQPPITTSFIVGSRRGSDPKRKYPYRYDGTNKYMDLDRGEDVELVEKKSKKIVVYLNNIKDSSPVDISKALIVTEYTRTGFGLRPLAEGLKENAITPTLLTVVKSQPGLGNNIDYIQSIMGYEAIHVGTFMDELPELWDKGHISGVVKHFSDLHAEPIRKSILYRETEPPKSEKDMMMATMSIARDEASHVADNLIAELLGPKESQ